jgi:transposase
MNKKRGAPEKASVKKILNAIPGTGGLISAIAVKLKVHYHTVLNYANKYETVRQAIEEEKEKILDKAESNLFIRIKEGDEDTSKWFLARKGKHRGYSEKIDTEQKIEHSGSLTVKTIEVDDKIAKKVLDEIAKEEMLEDTGNTSTEA